VWGVCKYSSTLTTDYIRPSRERSQVKTSRFNKSVDLGNGSKLLYNAATGAIAELPPETYQTVKKVLFSPNSAKTIKEAQLAEQLAYGGFLVEDEPDELTQMKIENGRHRFGNPVLSIGIAPTLECNLACKGCSAAGSKGRMTAQVQKALLGSSERYVRKCDEVQITWFGGEPLLQVETIERLQGGFAELAAKCNAGLAVSSIITNGHLLNPSMAERLKAAGVGRAQVTLDGPLEEHDSYRPLPDGKGTFERIVRNIAEVAEILDIVVRINVRRDRPSAASELVEMLDEKEILSQVGFFFGQTNGGFGVCADAASRCRLDREQARVQIELYRNLSQRVSCRLDFPYLLPTERCGFDSENSFLVAPNGYRYKCWEELSPNVDLSVGSVFSFETEPFQEANLWRFSSFDPFDRTECLECDILPICMGGCPVTVNRQTTFSDDRCSPLKQDLGELLVLRYLYEVREEVKK
jgi:uncharacterized protein